MVTEFEVEQNAVKGDAEGHEFHGNRYTGGIGGAFREPGDPKFGTFRLYHGTTMAAVDAAKHGDGYLPNDYRRVAAEVEKHFGLPKDSVLDHPHFFPNGKQQLANWQRNGGKRGTPPPKVPSMYLTPNRLLARYYSGLGSETVHDAIRAAAEVKGASREEMTAMYNEYKKDQVGVVLHVDVPRTDFPSHLAMMSGDKVKVTPDEFMERLRSGGELKLPSIPHSYVVATEVTGTGLVNPNGSTTPALDMSQPAQFYGDKPAVPVPGQKYSADQPRDDHGRFGEGSTFYHGSPTAGLTAVAARIDARQFDNATSQLGAFVTDDPKYAAQYAGKDGTVYEAAVVLQNPYHMSYSEFNYFQSPDKDADGKSLPGEQWEVRAAALKDEAIALRTRLESEGHDGIVVKGSGMRPTEVASFSDIPLTQKKEAKYSADEPRDDHGRWGDGGGVTWYHGTSQELKPGDVLTPGHEVRHGENDKVWVSDNAYQASKYGAFVYEVHPHVEPVGRQKANHEFSTVGAHVVGTVSESVIRDHSNQMAQEAADYDRRKGAQEEVKYSDDEPRGVDGRWGAGDEDYNEQTGKNRAVATGEKLPWPKTEAEFQGMMLNYKDGGKTTMDGTPVTPTTDLIVFHATEKEESRLLYKYGFTSEDKPQNLARMRYEAGEDATFAPGAGLNSGLYVASDPNEASGYGHQMLAIRVRVGDLSVPTEGGYTDPIRALLSGGAGAVINGPVPPENIRRFGTDPHMIPKPTIAELKSQKGEGTGHGFRGNRWTGGISGEGRQTTTPRAKRGDKVGPYKPRASKLTYEKMTAGQREAVHHIVVNMQRATAWGMRASEWANRPIGGPEPVSRPLHPDDRNSVIGAIRSLEAAGIDHEQLVRALTYDAASNRMGHSGSGNAGAYTVQQYSQDLQSLEHSEKPEFNPAELVPSKIELSRAEALAQEVMKPINEVRMAAVAKESQGSHLAEGLKDPTKFPVFARESLTAVAKLAERDHMLYNDHIPEEGKNLDRMYTENHAALMAVGRDVQTEIDRRIVSIPPPDPVKVEELNARVTQANLDVVRAHETYMSRYAATYAVRSETGWKTLPPSDPTYIAKSEEYERIGREILGLRDEYDRLSGIRDKAVMEQLALTRPDRLAAGHIAIQVLSEIRPFGYDLKDHVGTTSVSRPNPSRVALASFQAATAYFPKEWYERAFGRVLPGNGQRQRMNIGVSAKPSGSRVEVTTYRSGSKELLDSTSVHETGHFMEDVGGRSISQAEYEFMRARTTAPDGTREQTRSLDATNRAAGMGRWTRASDRSYPTYTDKFASVYMGKLYGGGGPNSNYELLTMGMENLRNPTSNSPKTDAEYKAFILGVLATL